MANDLNQCNFIGRLGKDVEMRYQPSGDGIASFSIAVGWKSKDKEGAEWVNITAFGKLAEICGKYLVKGSKVFISGRFKTDKYEKDGVTRYSTSIIANSMQMLDGKQDNQGQQSAPQQSAPQQNQQQNGGFDDSFDDDIPF